MRGWGASRPGEDRVRPYRLDSRRGRGKEGRPSGALMRPAGLVRWNPWDGDAAIGQVSIDPELSHAFEDSAARPSGAAIDVT